MFSIPRVHPRLVRLLRDAGISAQVPNDSHLQGVQAGNGRDAGTYQIIAIPAKEHGAQAKL